MLKDRQAQIAESIIEDEYEYTEEVDDAQYDYYHILNVLSTELGEAGKCVDIDPLLFHKYKKTLDKPNFDLSRKDVAIKLGMFH
jgi:hypothetical protein